MSFKIKFWGVRGSIPCPSPEHISIGGNTSCIEVSCGGTRIILDSGTGIRNLGHWLIRKNLHHATMLLSHVHWDHICGFPFFSPAFHKDFSLDIMAGHLSKFGGVRNVLAGQMTTPTFPVPLDALHSTLSFEDFKAGDSFILPANRRVKITTAALNHPDGATGYRIEYAGKSLCYVTDTEHVVGKPDQNILGLIEGTDLLIYDCTYTDKEFKGKIGWGHSTWQEGVRLSQAANVKSLAIFHHDPDHVDRFMERVEGEARLMWSGAFLAREHMRINLA